MRSFSHKNNFYLKILVGLVLFLVPVGQAFAAVMLLNPESTIATIGTQFTANIFLNTEGVSINGLQGAVSYPSDLLSVVKIDDGSSLINFWLTQPSPSDSGLIAFAGVTAGGFNGTQGFLFSITFMAKSTGSSTIGIQDLLATLDDGKATPAAVTIQSSHVSVTAGGPNVPPLITSPVMPVPIPQNAEDIAPPGAFTPAVSSSPDLFGGNYFITFVAQDKGVGMDHYEVCEGGKNCVVATSPYELKDQKLDESILVKAFDKNGNERDSLLAPQKPGPWQYAVLIAFAVLLVIVFLATIVFKRSIQKHFPKKTD